MGRRRNVSTRALAAAGASQVLAQIDRGAATRFQLPTPPHVPFFRQPTRPRPALPVSACNPPSAPPPAPLSRSARLHRPRRANTVVGRYHHHHNNHHIHHHPYSPEAAAMTTAAAGLAHLDYPSSASSPSHNVMDIDSDHVVGNSQAAIRRVSHSVI